jgi:hypothetical protein
MIRHSSRFGILALLINVSIGIGVASAVEARSRRAATSKVSKSPVNSRTQVPDFWIPISNEEAMNPASTLSTIYTREDFQAVEALGNTHFETLNERADLFGMRNRNEYKDWGDFLSKQIATLRRRKIVHYTKGQYIPEVNFFRRERGEIPELNAEIKALQGRLAVLDKDLEKSSHFGEADDLRWRIEELQKRLQKGLTVEAYLIDLRTSLTDLYKTKDASERIQKLHALKGKIAEWDTRLGEANASILDDLDAQSFSSFADEMMAQERMVIQSERLGRLQELRATPEKAEQYNLMRERAFARQESAQGSRDLERLLTGFSVLEEREGLLKIQSLRERAQAGDLSSAERKSLNDLTAKFLGRYDNLEDRLRSNAARPVFDGELRRWQLGKADQIRSARLLVETYEKSGSDAFSEKSSANADYQQKAKEEAAKSKAKLADLEENYRRMMANTKLPKPPTNLSPEEFIAKTLEDDVRRISAFNETAAINPSGRLKQVEADQARLRKQIAELRGLSQQSTEMSDADFAKLKARGAQLEDEIRALNGSLQAPTKKLKADEDDFFKTRTSDKNKAKWAGELQSKQAELAQIRHTEALHEAGSARSVRNLDLRRQKLQEEVANLNKLARINLAAQGVPELLELERQKKREISELDRERLALERQIGALEGHHQHLEGVRHNYQKLAYEHDKTKQSLAPLHSAQSAREHRDLGLLAQVLQTKADPTLELLSHLSGPSVRLNNSSGASVRVPVRELELGLRANSLPATTSSSSTNSSMSYGFGEALRLGEDTSTPRQVSLRAIIANCRQPAVSE